MGRPGVREFAGKTVLLGIRPEDVEIAQFSKPAGAVANFPAIVDIVEPMGAETNLYLQTGAHTVICRSQRALDHREAGHRLEFELNVAKAHSSMSPPAGGSPKVSPFPGAISARFELLSATAYQ